MPWRCECCASDLHVNTYRASGRYHASLCRDCAVGGHGIESCVLCAGTTWHCQRLAHMHARHRRMLEYVMNAPAAEFAPPPFESPQKLIGTVRFTQAGLPGGED